jgi:hypothetical protein
MMNWAYRWFRDGGRLSIEDVAREIISLFFSGIFKEGVLLDGSRLGLDGYVPGK